MSDASTTRALADAVHVQADEQRDRDRAGDGERAPRAAGDDLHAPARQRDDVAIGFGVGVRRRWSAAGRRCGLVNASGRTVGRRPLAIADRAACAGTSNTIASAVRPSIARSARPAGSR